ncbi:MAG: 30S ribosomal protein S16 [Alphaproteobacteria bacterium]|nr:30S ribosomal protein S16 [Alphaproteobacteria bacterium]
MALSIRMARGGRKGRPHYSIVVADRRAPRDGRFIERLGTHNPLLPTGDERRVVLNEERIKYWLSQGAEPSSRVARFLGQAGIIDMPKWQDTPKKSAQSEKTKMRIAEKEEKRQAAADAAKQAEEEAKAAAEAPAEEAAAESPAEEAAAEKGKAE